jgi:phenylacetate-coenzyme A ligase PaaK-like adenylate-forming protein
MQIRPEQIVTLGDLVRLPLLTKNDVRDHLYFDLFADNHRKREMQKVTTNGVDAEPLDLYVGRMQLEMRLAGFLRARTWDSDVREYGIPECRGIAYECAARAGHHVAAESYIVEVLKGRQPALPGEVGDVVITDLDSFQVPLIRYRTGDRAVAVEGVCGCGRGLRRIGRIEQAAATIGMMPGETGREVSYAAGADAHGG